MARQPKKTPSFNAIRNKIGEAHFFLHYLKRHRDQQRDAAKPAAYEFFYYLSAFSSAAITVSDLMKKITPAWWDQLNRADGAVHDLFWEMRKANVHEGEIETNKRTEKVNVRPSYDQRVHGFLFQSMFGEVMTFADTHSMDVDGIEREVVELCEEYLAILRREAGALEKQIQTASKP